MLFLMLKLHHGRIVGNPVVDDGSSEANAGIGPGISPVPLVLPVLLSRLVGALPVASPGGVLRICNP